MSALLLGAALKQEIKAIRGAAQDGQPPKGADGNFEQQYEKWFFENPSEDWFLLKPDHFIDAAGFLQDLKKPGSESVSGCLVENFTPELQERLKTDDFEKWSNAIL